MRTFLAANWKMYLYPEEARALLLKLKELAEGQGAWDFPVVICPSYLYLPLAAEILKGTFYQIGAQNGYPGEQGARTGEVSMGQLRATGCTHVIVGHSERRQYLGETGDLLRAKLLNAQKQGLTVIYCIGETIAQRESDETLTTLRAQLEEVLRGGEIQWERLVIAYEPVWAIGTGVNATPEQAQEAHGFIRQWLCEVGAPAEQIPILYGGSIRPANAEGIFAQADVDGGLVGGASLVAEDFWAIASTLQRARQRIASGRPSQL